jgi:acyl-coenzyme A thioesterase PaaI-like protein
LAIGIATFLAPQLLFTELALSLEPNTHLRINTALCGEPVELDEGCATVSLATRDDMAVDERGLVHGGFVFGLADYAAMLAVNDPNVVLGAANARFLAPVTVGQTIVATAQVSEENGNKRVIDATASVGDNEVFHARFTTFVLDQHVLED